MPRFFFHIDDGEMLPDADGTELADIDAVRHQAVTLSGQVLRDTGGSYWEHGKTWRLHVTDAESQLLFTLNFSAEEPSGPVIFRPAVG